MNRLLKYLSLKSLALPSAKITKLSSQGFVGEVYSLDSEREHFILKFYRAGSEKIVAKVMHIFRSLSDLGVPVPKVYLADVKGKILKRPFLMMQKLEGEDFSSLIKRGKGKEFVEALALSLHKLHSISIESLRSDMPKREFKDEVSEMKIEAGALVVFSMAPLVFYRAYKALSKIPNLYGQGNPLALLHGDCGPHNVIYSNGTVYLIDLDSVYIGDPAADLGYAYHLIKGTHIYHIIKFGARSKPDLAEYFIDAYEKLYGKVAGLETYKRLAALKLAIIFRFLMGFLSFKRTPNLLAMRKQLSAFINYCLTYAEKGRVELEALRSLPPDLTDLIM